MKKSSINTNSKEIELYDKKLPINGKELAAAEALLNELDEYDSDQDLIISSNDGPLPEKFLKKRSFYLLLDFGYKTPPGMIMNWKLKGLPSGIKTFRAAITKLSYKGKKRGSGTLALMVSPLESSDNTTAAVNFRRARDVLKTQPLDNNDDEPDDDQEDGEAKDVIDVDEYDAPPSTRKRPRARKAKDLYDKMSAFLKETSDFTGYTITSLEDKVLQPFSSYNIILSYKSSQMHKFRLDGPNNMLINFYGYFSLRDVLSWRIGLRESKNHKNLGVYEITGAIDGRRVSKKKHRSEQESSEAGSDGDSDVRVVFPSSPPPIIQSPPRISADIPEVIDEEEVPAKLPRWFTKYLLTGNEDVERQAIKQLMADPTIRSQALTELKTEWSEKVHQTIQAKSIQDNWEVAYRSKRESEISQEINRRLSMELLQDSAAARKRQADRLEDYEKREMAKINIRLDMEARQKVILEYEQNMARTKLQQIQQSKKQKTVEPYAPKPQSPIKFTPEEEAFLNNDL